MTFPAGSGSTLRRDVAHRVGSALVLAPLALLAAYFGGWPFVAFWCAAAIGVFAEWIRIVTGSVVVLACGAFVLAVAAVLAGAGETVLAIGVLIIGATLVGGVSGSGRRSWRALGLVYAGALLAGPIVLRGDAEDGFLAVVFLFAVVWATDVFSYFTGRTVGGPKLWLWVSPKKTWSGAIGGLVGGLAAALAIAQFAALTNLLAVAALALLLSAVSQAGDLLESAFKRRFGVKDAGHLIPGHGGIMDRIDGFLAAALVAAIIGVARGGLDAPGRGLLAW